MKVMLRLSDAGKLLVYVAKKDLEEEVVQQVDSAEGRVFTLANGWELVISDWSDSIRLPQTVEAKRLA